FNQSPFYKLLSDSQQKQIHEALQGPNLWTCLDNWLSRTPFLNNPNYNFWKEYRQAAENMLKEDREVIANNPRLDDEGKKKNLAMIDQSLKTIQSLFDPKAYEELRPQGYFRLSYEAIHAALFIQIYLDEPVLQIPFKMISAICDLDEVMTQWRYRHALMVHRMLGKKIGTGGSSGHQYLKDATEQHKIFTDLFNLTTFLIPRS